MALVWHSLTLQPAAQASANLHRPIVIDGDSEFTPANGVTGGGGTAGDPFLIEGWRIEVNGLAIAAIQIRNTTAPFVIRGVQLHSSLFGIHLSNVTHGRIEGTTASGTGMGFYLDRVSTVSIANSSSSHGKTGIAVYSSQAVTITGNNISSNFVQGVDLRQSEGVIVATNTLWNNRVGIYATGSDHWTYHNNFVGNGEQALDEGEGGSWHDDYPRGGNYWSDYAGEDGCRGPAQDVCDGKDGIGDVPHALDPDTLDRYPLMLPFPGGGTLAPAPMAFSGPALYGAVGAGAATGAAALLWEPARRLVLSALLPLYYRLRRRTALEHFVRGQVYGYIMAHPGASYSEVRDAFDLNNGTASYHLTVLESLGFIRSVKDGRYRRYSPVGAAERRRLLRLSDMQLRLLQALRGGEAMTPSEVAAVVGISRQRASYNLRRLSSMRLIREHPGRRGRYQVIQDPRVSDPGSPSPS
jgi:parallel beta-helix repeat protein